MENTKIIKQLIVIGNTQAANVSNLDIPYDRSHTQLFEHQIERVLTLDDSISLIKGLTLFKEKHTGSTTIIPNLIDSLDKKVHGSPEGQLKVLELLNWLIENRGYNLYLPYGYTLNKKFQKELKTYIPRKMHIRMRYERIESENIERSVKAKEERKRKKDAKMAIHNIVIEERNLERNKILDNLEKLSELEKINYILKDEQHPINYFPQEYAGLFEKMLPQLNQDQQIKLLQRLESAQKGKWKEIKKLINK